MEWWRQISTVAWQFLEQHGQLGAFVFLVFEEAGTPVPIPGDFIMVLVGARAAQGHLNLLEVLAVMELATVLGASFLYWISARAGRRVVYRLGRHVGLTPARLDRAAEELNRRGALAVVLGRMTPGLRMATPIICGVFRFPFRIYLPAMALGAFLYLLFYTLLGYFFGPRVLGLLESVELPLSLLASAALLGLLAFWTVRAGRRTGPPERCPEPSERLRAGIAAGLVATLASGLLVNVLVHLCGLLAFKLPGAGLARLFDLMGHLAARAPGPAVAVLLPAFLLVGAGLGGAYGVWLGNASSGRGPLRGAAFALLPLGGSLLVALPLAGAGPAGVELGAGALPALGEAARHLVFGLVLGTLYPGLARPRQLQRRDPAAVPPAEGPKVVPSVA